MDPPLALVHKLVTNADTYFVKLELTLEEFWELFLNDGAAYTQLQTYLEQGARSATATAWQKESCSSASNSCMSRSTEIFRTIQGAERRVTQKVKFWRLNNSNGLLQVRTSTPDWAQASKVTSVEYILLTPELQGLPSAQQGAGAFPAGGGAAAEGSVSPPPVLSLTITHDVEIDRTGVGYFIPAGHAKEVSITSTQADRKAWVQKAQGVVREKKRQRAATAAAAAAAAGAAAQAEAEAGATAAAAGEAAAVNADKADTAAVSHVQSIDQELAAEGAAAAAAAAAPAGEAVAGTSAAPVAEAQSAAQTPAEQGAPLAAAADPQQEPQQQRKESVRARKSSRAASSAGQQRRSVAGVDQEGGADYYSDDEEYDRLAEEWRQPAIPLVPSYAAKPLGVHVQKHYSQGMGGEGTAAEVPIPSSASPSASSSLATAAAPVDGSAAGSAAPGMASEGTVSAAALLAPPAAAPPGGAAAAVPSVPVRPSLDPQLPSFYRALSIQSLLWSLMGRSERKDVQQEQQRETERMRQAALALQKQQQQEEEKEAAASALKDAGLPSADAGHGLDDSELPSSMLAAMQRQHNSSGLFSRVCSPLGALAGWAGAPVDAPKGYTGPVPWEREGVEGDTAAVAGLGTAVYSRPSITAQLRSHLVEAQQKEAAAKAALSGDPAALAGVYAQAQRDNRSSAGEASARWLGPEENSSSKTQSQSSSERGGAGASTSLTAATAAAAAAAGDGSSSGFVLMSSTVLDGDYYSAAGASSRDGAMASGSPSAAAAGEGEDDGSAPVPPSGAMAAREAELLAQWKQKQIERQRQLAAAAAAGGSAGGSAAAGSAYDCVLM